MHRRKKVSRMPNDTLTILAVPVFSPLCNLAFALRREVFIVEQQIPEAEEFDGADLAATHFVAIKAGAVAGSIRLQVLPEHVKIGRVVVAAAWRGHGIAKAMMLHVMDLARADGADRFYLTAQVDKLGFYQRPGFVEFGEEFDHGGIPHLAMKTY